MTQSKKTDDTFTIDINDIIDFNDDVTIDIGNLSAGDIYTMDTSNISDYTIGSDLSSITIDTATAYDVNLDWATNITFDRVMFEDDMPDPQELKKMCEEYPALEKVYENFKTIYKMVEQDWKGKNDNDEEFPF